MKVWNSTLESKTPLKQRTPLKARKPMKKISGRFRQKLDLSIKWKEAVHDKDGWHCAICGSAYDLDAHHIYGKQAFPEWRYVIENGLTVCRLCHIDIHNGKIDIEKYIGRTLRDLRIFLRNGNGKYIDVQK